ncbi:MAG: hypothetical protein ACFFC3_11115 [Candidatus Odinarchaeota archaeon]
MAEELTNFILAKKFEKMGKLDEYIKNNWGNVYRRWREQYSKNSITLEKQIK